MVVVVSTSSSSSSSSSAFTSDALPRALGSRRNASVVWQVYDVSV